MLPAATLLFGDIPILGAQSVFEDSFYIPNFVQTCLPWNVYTLYDEILRSAPWTAPDNIYLLYRGFELRRTKAFLYGTDERQRIPVYRYPGFQWRSLQFYRRFSEVPVIEQIADILQNQLKVNNQGIFLNHVIATRYCGPEDNIGYHSDKTRDITKNSPILMISFGESRELHFGFQDPEDSQKTNFERAFTLNAGDLFVLGPKTNLLHKHCIVPVDEERNIARDPEREIGSRISLVLRNISTKMTTREIQKEILKTDSLRVKRREKKKEKRTTSNSEEKGASIRMKKRKSE